MAGETIITVIGNLTDDPELKFTPSGAPVANFTVASTPRTFDRQTNEWKDGDALFLRCAAWRQLAENVAESLTKGQRVIVTGALRVRQFERQDGSKGTSVELNVDEVGPSLKFATAKVTKATRSGTPGGGFGGGGSAADPWASGQPAQQAPATDAWNTGGGAGGSTEETPF
jgi:single-strand DNA-binding protein